MNDPERILAMQKRIEKLEAVAAKVREYTRSHADYRNPPTWKCICWACTALDALDETEEPQ